MKTLSLIFLLSLSSLAQAKFYSCEYEINSRTEKVDVKTYKRSAKIEITKGNQVYTYRNCELDRDDFGTLVDCSNRELDLMVLINPERRKTTGGIMSNTFDLFTDLDC